MKDFSQQHTKQENKGLAFHTSSKNQDNQQIEQSYSHLQPRVNLIHL